MKIKSITIENCKSFKDQEKIDFDQPVTIMVGPNGGGKSNILDILTVVIKKYLFHTYRINEGSNATGFYKDIQQQNLFGDTNKFLDKYEGYESNEQNIELKLRVGATDIRNIKNIKTKKTDLNSALDNYRNKPLSNFDFTDQWDLSKIYEGDEVIFRIYNGNLQGRTGELDKIFLQYLNHLHLVMLLASDVQEFEIQPTLIYFSPYRSADPQDLQANLSQENFFNLLYQYQSSTSKTNTSLIKLASVFFAEKMLSMRDEAKHEAWGPRWEEDEDVQFVTNYMEPLGYEWSLETVDKNKNIFRILLKISGREIGIDKASSGEKEILNFLLGITALRTKGGMIIVDEPELHLHPRWQITIRDLLIDMAEETGNQIILSTHSAVFISPNTIQNVKRVAKNSDQSTKTVSISEEDLEDKRTLVHIVNSHNNERILFADKVLLVEGLKDRIILKGLIEAYRQATNNKAIIEVVEVGGKDYFNNYRELLNALHITNYILADFDYLVDLKKEDIKDLLETKWKSIDDKVLKDKKSKDRGTLAENLEKAINEKDFEDLHQIWEYIKNRKIKLRDDLTDEENSRLDSILEELFQDKIHVLREGEIEHYLPEGFTSMDGAINLTQPENLSKWIEEAKNKETYIELEQFIAHLIEIDSNKVNTVREKAISQLKYSAGKLRKEK